jgi:modulator of FtsH protease HflC
MRAIKTVLIPVLILLSVLLVLTAYQVHQTQTAIILRLGKYSRTVDTPGLHFRLPFLEQVTRYEKWLMDYDAEPRGIITKDKKNIVVDNYAKWRIVDPLLFYQTVRSPEGAQRRLDDIIYSELRQSIGSFTLEEIVRVERARIMTEVTARADEQSRRYGIEIRDVRIKRADLPRENEGAVYQRMKTEREREAKLYRSEGEEEATKIRAQADKERQILLAEAAREAQEIQGRADAEAIRIFAAAYGKDVDFFRFFRSLEAYRRSLKTGTTLVLTPEMEMLRFLQSSGATWDDTSKPRHTQEAAPAAERSAPGAERREPEAAAPAESVPAPAVPVGPEGEPPADVPPGPDR